MVDGVVRHAHSGSLDRLRRALLVRRARQPQHLPQHQAPEMDGGREGGGRAHQSQSRSHDDKPWIRSSKRSTTTTRSFE